MIRKQVVFAVAALFGFLVIAGCGQQKIERLTAENIKAKEQIANLQNELEEALAENTALKAKLDTIQGILSPPQPAPKEGAAPEAAKETGEGEQKAVAEEKPAAPPSPDAPKEAAHQ